jgi:hypothetical protein
MVIKRNTTIAVAIRVIAIVGESDNIEDTLIMSEETTLLR